MFGTGDASGGRRRKGSLLLVVLVGLVAFFMVMRQAAPVPPAFDLHVTLDQASRAAEKSGMPVLVFATADWCGYCQQLKRGALADSTVDQWIRLNTHPVYLDCTKEVPAEARELPIDGYPTLIMLRHGKPVAVVAGNVPTKELIAWFERNAGALNDEKARIGG